mmetsp:Transcript_4830/g.10659  ORF Transcript_4830/g.10659 Transcript_4830/m.10659 type:complete len:231 (-) Transcript_4830:800-1492(-)
MQRHWDPLLNLLASFHWPLRDLLALALALALAFDQDLPTAHRDLLARQEAAALLPQPARLPDRCAEELADDADLLVGGAEDGAADLLQQALVGHDVAESSLRLLLHLFQCLVIKLLVQDRPCVRETHWSLTAALDLPQVREPGENMLSDEACVETHEQNVAQVPQQCHVGHGVAPIIILCGQQSRPCCWNIALGRQLPLPSERHLKSHSLEGALLIKLAFKAALFESLDI